MVLLVSILAMAAAPVAILAPQTVPLADRTVRISDVVTAPAALPPAARRVVIAMLPVGGGKVAVPRTALANLVRRRLPGLAVHNTGLVGTVTFVAPRPIPAQAAHRGVGDKPEPFVKRGAALRLTSAIGPVRIERTVTALQSSDGKRVFVRDADGSVFAARVGHPGAAR